MMTAQAWCSRAIRVEFSAALANLLPAASSTTAAAAMILTERVARRSSRADGSSCCVGVALDELKRKHLTISFKAVCSSNRLGRFRPRRYARGGTPAQHGDGR